MVLALGPHDQTLVALSLSRSIQADLSLQKQALVLAELREDPRLADWRLLLPEVLAHGEAGGKRYQVSAWLPGVDARLVLSDQPSRQRMLLAAVTAISQFHQYTATSLLVDAAVLERWIYLPVANLQALCQGKPASYRSSLERLVAELSASLLGVTLPVSWIHGDFWPANFLVTPDGERLTGIIDWDQASSADLPFLDLFNLLISPACTSSTASWAM
jgi:aminoglycoside phosphotransferase (APT) family kinase protein